MLCITCYLYNQMGIHQEKITYPMDEYYTPGEGYVTWSIPMWFSYNPFSIHHISKVGLGELHYSYTGTLQPPWCRPDCSRVSTESFHMFVATVPQLVVSALYVLLNHHLTLMIQLRDWIRLATHRQPLRVSTPAPDSDQISTYWLSLPYQYSVPLLVLSAGSSWLTSQTLYFYRFMAYDNDGEPHLYDNPASSHIHTQSARVVQGLGFSALGLFLLLVLGALVFFASLAFALRKCAPGLPPGPTNSLVVAAACHPPGNDRYAARKKVRWGVVENGRDGMRPETAQHCTITSRRVASPVVGRWYM